MPCLSEDAGHPCYHGHRDGRCTDRKLMADENKTVATAAEQRVLDAIDARGVADFSSLPASERRLSAEFLHRLISGADSVLCCPLRIRGADIEGRLLPPTSSGNDGHVAVQFWNCNFNKPVDLSGANFLVLRFVDCTMPAFIGASLRVSAELDLSGSTITGVRDYKSELVQVGTAAVHLSNARIGGKLDLSSTKTSRFCADGTVRLSGAHIDGDVNVSGAKLMGNGAPALSARTAIIGGNVKLCPAFGHRFEANGEVVFVAAQITGDLDCRGARLINPSGRALHCEDLKVESVLLSADMEAGIPLEASGRLNFLTAIIGGSFFMSNARLSPGPDYSGILRTGGRVALNIQQARISNAFAVANIGALGDESRKHALDDPLTPVQGWFLLTGTKVGAIRDDLNTGWPAAGFLDLDGATYERIRHVNGGDLIAMRIHWLRRQFLDEVPRPDTFRPQPYEQLSQVFRQHGLAKEANAIAVEKIRMRLQSHVDSRQQRIFPQLLMLISQYGYSSRRAISSFLILVGLGTAMYATALFGFDQQFLPVESDPEPINYTFVFGLLEQPAERGCPGLHVVHYALDAALPVIDLSQDLRCRFTPEGPWRALWLLLHSLYILCGAALSAVVVLTLTGVLRDD